MMKLGFTAGMLGLCLLGCSDEEDETRPSAFDKLVEGLGGQADLDALTGLRIAGSGERNVPHEGRRPEDPAVQVNNFMRTVSIDLSADSLRVDTTRNVEILFPSTAMYSDVVRGNLGASTEPFFGMPLGALSSDKAAAIRRQETLLTPHLLLKWLDESSLMELPDVQLDRVTHHRLATDDRPGLTLFIDAQTGRLSKLETMEHDFYMRDVKLEVLFSDWDRAGNIVFPRSVSLVRDDHTLFTQTVSNVEVNPSFTAGTFEFPGNATPALNQDLFNRGELSHQWYYLLDSLGLPFSGVDTSVMPRELAPGVLQLMGGSHHSFVVEQANGIVLVDAPFYEDRGRALSEFIATTFPGKPITHVVASHFHEDHAAGIREVLGSNASAQLVVHESVQAAWREILAAPSTLRPDALATTPRQVTILTVPDASELTLADAAHPLTLYPVETDHSDDMLMVHEASSNAVFIVDIYSPGNPTQLNADDFAASLTTHAIPTAGLKIVGGHGGEVHDYAMLQAQLPPP
jgi:glyoxylase-like metal-dependent hydrolase (beta-lactamase superfamily II)